MDRIYFDGSYQSSNPNWHAEDSPWKAKQIAALLKKNQVTAESICEVGCGTGEILTQLMPTYPDTQFVGYEVSPQAFEICKRKQSNRIRFRLEDLTTQNDAFYDVVLAIDVLEHVEDYLGFIQNLRNKGKMKVFHIPLDLSVQSILRLRPILAAREKVGHLHYFLKDTAIATLQDCGYKIIDHVYTASRLELPNQARSSRLMRLPRKILHKLNPDLAVRVLGGYSLLVLAK